MRMLVHLVPMFAFGLNILFGSYLNATSSSIHYRTSHEQFDDCLDDEDCDSEEEEEHKRWYHSHRYREAYDDSEDPTEELEHDAAWPGKRDDSWDQLFR